MRNGLWVLFWMNTLVACAQATQQGCLCDQVITKSGTYKYDGRAMPHRMVCIMAGVYTHLQFFNYTGIEGKPIQFVNCGGKVTLANSKSPSGLAFYDCQFFKVSGSGADYGIRIDRTAPGGQGVNVTGKSSDFEIEYIEVASAEFAGIMVKTDPTCDTSTWQENLVMRNVKIHHNYIHDVGGEGMYIGNSFFSQGMLRTCDGTPKKVYPHFIYGLDVYNNLIERTGAEGIQYACAPDALVHHNVIKTTGLSPFATYQNNGIQIGGGAGGRLYSNRVSNIAGTGVIVIGHLGDTFVYNNYLFNCGEMGIFCDDRAGSEAGAAVALLNNTIIGCGQQGIKLYNEINRNCIVNNVIANVTPNQFGRVEYVAFGNGATATVANNRFSASLDSLGLTESVEEGFRLSSKSPLIDAGLDVTDYSIFFDLTDNWRKIGLAVDIGAYEFMPDDALVLFPNPTKDVLTIHSGTIIDRITIVDEQGTAVRESVPISKSDVASINVRLLQAGIYIVNVETTVGKQAKRFVKF